uniref:Uncharacterized protein n=1 Tax=Noctiluca scintillans TaxID=2966 RepID=A0A7S1A5R9_NOCSC|mmetsp:Transcript_31752/g.84749  ORF Transcript_31752/g.84749 Transcript_31752/m.84749 type:complete len:1021 (+) Transcript_31752:111-3173(+)
MEKSKKVMPTAISIDTHDTVQDGPDDLYFEDPVNPSQLETNGASVVDIATPTDSACAEQEASPRVHGRSAIAPALGESMLRVFREPDKILQLDLAPLHRLQDLCNDVVASQDKATMRAVALVNHFATINEDLLGPGSELQMFISVIGNTSAAKDVTCAQLLGKGKLAVSGKEMTTAAPVYYTVLQRTDGGTVDRYKADFRGHTVYAGEDAEALRGVVLRLMEQIRDTADQHTSDKLAILVESGEEAVPSFILNNIGMMPTATAGTDTVWEQQNRELNFQRDRKGGVLVICVHLEQATDKSAAFLDLDVVKEYKANPAQSNFQIIVARTKADIWECVEYQNCTTFKDVYDLIFGEIERKLPGVDMYMVTGWRANDPRDEGACRDKFEHTMDEVFARVIRENPEEVFSPWRKKLDERLGTERLKQKYHSLVRQQGEHFLRVAQSCLEQGQRSLKQRVTDIYNQTKTLSNRSLAGDIPELCLLVEKLASVVRSNNLERPSSACVELEVIRTEAMKMQQTFAEEFRQLHRTYGDLVRTAHGGDVASIVKHFNAAGLAMNGESHHSFWARMVRLKANAHTVAKLYELPWVSTREINSWTKTSTVRNSSDVEHFLLIHVLNRVKCVFREELAPLFSRWIAYYVQQSYTLAMKLAFLSERGAPMKGNIGLERVLERVLEKIYHDDVYELIMKKALDRQPSFVERISVERDRREEVCAQKRSVERWSARSHEVNDHGDRQGELFWDFLSNVVFGVADVENNKDTMQRDSTKNATSVRKILNENPTRIFNPSLFLKLDDDEGEYLNQIGRFFFEELLTRCITFFFRETEATLDFLYAENRYEVDAEFLFKNVYFQAKEDAKSTEPDLFREHEAKLDVFPPVQRYQGYNMRQLLKDGLVTFKGAVGERRCPECEYPLSMPFCGVTGKKHVEQINESRGMQPHAGLDPFSGIVDCDVAMPDLSYQWPEAAIPGYRALLHDEVSSIAKKFLGKFFDDKDDCLNALRTKANKYSVKYRELLEVQRYLTAAQKV